MLNISDFDLRVKTLVLGGEYESLQNYLSKTINPDITFSNDQWSLLNSLLNQYSTDARFSDVLGKVHPTFVKNLISSNQSNFESDILVTKSRNESEAEILIFCPEYSTKSAGIRIYHQLISLLRDNNFNVEVYNYRNDIDLNEYFLNYSIKDKVVIIPETISRLPFTTNNLIIYHGNIRGELPSTSLGSFDIDYDSAIKFTHSKSLYPSYKRLFISTVDFNSFYPSKNSKLGGVAIYLGKRELKSDFIDAINYFSKRFNTSLILTRNFPDSSLIPIFARELSLLITLDHFSSMNLEFTLSGCNVFFPPEITTLEYQIRIQNYELFNSNMILRYKDLDNLVPNNSLDVHDSLAKISYEIQNKDIESFILLLHKLINI